MNIDWGTFTDIDGGQLWELFLLEVAAELFWGLEVVYFEDDKWKIY